MLMGKKKFDINLEKNGSLVDNIRVSALTEKLFFSSLNIRLQWNETYQLSWTMQF